MHEGSLGSATLSFCDDDDDEFVGDHDGDAATAADDNDEYQ